jgi:hypothetical protein
LAIHIKISISSRNWRQSRGESSGLRFSTASARAWAEVQPGSVTLDVVLAPGAAHSIAALALSAERLLRPWLQTADSLLGTGASAEATEPPDA